MEYTVTDIIHLPVQPPNFDVLSVPNETTFRVRDAEPRDRALYRRLKKHNLDKIKRVDTKLWRDVDQQYHNHLFEAICSQLDLSETQTKQAKKWYQSLDRGRLGQQCDLVAFCVCIHAIERDCENGCTRRYHPSRNDENNDQEFVRVANGLMSRFGFDKWAIASMFNKLNTRLSG